MSLVKFTVTGARGEKTKKKKKKSIYLPAIDSTSEVCDAFTGLSDWYSLTSRRDPSDTSLTKTRCPHQDRDPFLFPLLLSPLDRYTSLYTYKYR